MMNKNKIIVALDSNNLTETGILVDKLKNYTFAFKIGYEFFFNFGIEGYNIIKEKGVKIFLDLKLHDIPNTIEQGIKAITKLNPYFTTIHISGGDEMQKASLINKKNIKILGVSILTSLDKFQVKKYYNTNDINNLVKKFVENAIKNKLDGVVCSPYEIELVKKIAKDNLIIVTPGIRPENYNINDDQKRILTPKKAIRLGANFLVIGRPITQSSDPLNEIISINSSIEKI